MVLGCRIVALTVCCSDAVAVLPSMRWIRRPPKGQLLIPSLILRVYLVCMLKGLGNCVVRESLNHMIRRSKVFQMRQETGLALFLKAHHSLTPQRERTLSQRQEPNAETASSSVWNCRTASKLACGSRGMFQWQVKTGGPLVAPEDISRTSGSISLLSVLGASWRSFLCFCSQDSMVRSLRAPGLASPLAG